MKKDYKALGKLALENHDGFLTIVCADKILEENPDDYEGWTLKFHGLLEKQNISNDDYREIIVSMQHRVSVSDNKEATYQKTTEEFLSFIVLKNLRVMHNLKKTDEVQSIYQMLVRSNSTTASDITSLLDNVRSVEDEYALLGLTVAESTIDKDLQVESIRDIVRAIADSFIKETEALDERMRVYGRCCEDKNDRVARANALIRRLGRFE